MKTINEYLFSKKSDLDKIKTNRFGITKKDLEGALIQYPLSIIIKALEERENQTSNFDFERELHRFKYGDLDGLFDWSRTVDGHRFWSNIQRKKDFKEFYEKYPEYKKYDL